MSVLILILGIILFISLVVIHEFGHFITARRNGVVAEEFGIFFPPRLYSRKMKGGWTFSINLLPLGGFVKLKGEHDTDTEQGAYGAASLWAKTKIMAAGVFMNLLVALVLLTILAVVGIPKIIPNQFTIANDTKVSSQKVLIGQVEANSPAAKAGLHPQDILTGIGKPGQHPVSVSNASKLPELTKRFAGQKVDVYYQHDGTSKMSTTTLVSAQAVTASQKAYEKEIQNTKLDCAAINLPKGYLGISPTQYTIQRSTWSAPVTAIGLSAQVTALTFQGLGHAIGGLGSLIAGFVTGNNTARSNGQCAATSQVAGPVGIFVILKDGSNLGLAFMLFIIAIISLTLAIMNILPIPALDGGRLWLTLITRAINRPLSARREELINATGFIILICLIILITIVDVQRFF
ncbi:MAG TPA: M50 family metallopeptidase [Candidatus Saccharimonadales bacterium]|nr:M50 family metallopeptidase [Candidatus Saccharimonadales bacterium]